MRGWTRFVPALVLAMAVPHPGAATAAPGKKAKSGSIRKADAAARRAMGRALAPPAPTTLDGARMPSTRSPPVVDPGAHARARKEIPTRSLGWTDSMIRPRAMDTRRRLPHTANPGAFGSLLKPGEQFRFDVSFSGNPAGLAEAKVVAYEPDARGGPPRGAPLLRIEGHARTSGIVSLLATVTDDIVTTIDAHSGAPTASTNVIHYAGFAPRKYRHRVTTQTYEGRGQVRIVDQKDERSRTLLKPVPVDTFDPMSVMAWVRSLDQTAGHRAKAHAIDGTTLLRVEIVSKGRVKMERMPSIAKALGLRDDTTHMIEGTITRVDPFDQAIPGKRVFKLRAWLSSDDRRIPLAMESDMWVGSIRLELTHYDPPHGP